MRYCIARAKPVPPAATGDEAGFAYYPSGTQFDLPTGPNDLVRDPATGTAEAAPSPRPNMVPPSPELVELARRIVGQEAGGSPDPAASAAAVETACRRLRDELVDLLGSGGVSAVFYRALHLARREQPVLAGLPLNGQSDECFTGLSEALEASTDEEAAEAAVTIVTQMVDVLIMLLGEELGMQPIRKLWPQATRVREIDE